MAVLRVKEPFSVDIKGAAFVFSAGQLVDSSHPAVKGREHLFETVDQWMGRQDVGSRVEQATATPGEKRSVSTKKAAPKHDDG
jgi:hypothetical protein